QLETRCYLGQVLAVSNQRGAAGGVEADAGDPPVGYVEAEDHAGVVRVAAARAGDRARRLAISPEATVEQLRDRRPRSRVAARFAADGGHRAVLMMITASAAGTSRVVPRRRRSKAPPP